MTQYIIRRVLLMIPTLIGVSLLVTAMVRLLPGDAVDILITENAIGGGNEAFIGLINNELEEPSWPGVEPVGSDESLFNDFNRRLAAENDIYALQDSVQAKADEAGVDLNDTEARRAFVQALPSADRLSLKNTLALDAYKDSVRARLGLDKNYIEQWWSWMTNAVQGDLGKTITGGRPVSDELKNRIPATFQLGILAMVFGTLIALPTGILSAVKQDSYPDYLLRGAAIAMLALPSFFIATMAIAGARAWFGYSFPTIWKDFWESPGQNLQLVLAPAIILGFALSGTLMRLTRAQMLEVLRQDYIRTARAKGLASRSVVLGHAVRNALLPVITILGLQIPILIGGSLVLEQIFAIPGIAKYLFDSINQREFPAVIAINMVIAFVIVLSNLVVDVTYGWLDPRVQLS